MNKGFIALTITLSVAGILLALVAASSIQNALFFDQAMRKVYREMNYYYAYDCIDQAILGLAHDYFYAVSTPQEIPLYHCTILSIEKDGDLRKISTRGDLEKAYVYRKATVRMKTNDLEIIEP